MTGRNSINPRWPGSRTPARPRHPLAGSLLWALLAAGLPALSGCANPKILQASEGGVTVRYGGTFTTLNDAIAAAKKACAAHKKRALLRTVSFPGPGRRDAHFACLKN